MPHPTQVRGEICVNPMGGGRGERGKGLVNRMEEEEAAKFQHHSDRYKQNSGTRHPTQVKGRKVYVNHMGGGRGGIGKVCVNPMVGGRGCNSIPPFSPLIFPDFH